MPLSSRRKIAYSLVALWAILVPVALYLFFFQRDWVLDELKNAYLFSTATGCLVYLLFGCIRGFTLIPSTYLVFAALAFFPPTLLFFLTLVGILISSASIYLFSEKLQLDEYFERKHPAGIAKVKGALQRHELPIIIGWSFFPLAPTDLICYVCGVLHINFPKFLIGVLIGEGTICGLYIFLGDQTLRWLHLR